jgi:hypothetical protein
MVGSCVRLRVGSRVSAPQERFLENDGGSVLAAGAEAAASWSNSGRSGGNIPIRPAASAVTMSLRHATSHCGSRSSLRRHRRVEQDRWIILRAAPAHGRRRFQRARPAGSRLLIRIRGGLGRGL